jgi:RNA polymerase sigma-70 factor (ECF subfamily)
MSSSAAVPAAGSPDDLARRVATGDRIAASRLRELAARADASFEVLAPILDPLAAAAAAGSLAAVDVLVGLVDELDLARPTIRRLVLDPADVDEVAQDVLVAVAQGIGGYREEARFTTWLHQVARYRAIDHLRRRARDRADAATPVLEALGPSARISSMIATRATLREVIASLDPAYRDPVVLRDVEHLSYEEVAARLGLNVNTARTRIARGRAQVAARMAGG